MPEEPPNPSPEQKRVQEAQKAADTAAERASHLRFEAARDLKNAERQHEHAAQLRKQAVANSVEGGNEGAWREAEKSERYAKQLEKDAAERQREADEAQLEADELQEQADAVAEEVGAANPQQPSVEPEPTGPTGGETDPGASGQGAEPGTIDLTGQDDDTRLASDDTAVTAEGDAAALASTAASDEFGDFESSDSGFAASDQVSDFESGSDLEFTTPEEPMVPSYESDGYDAGEMHDEPAPLEDLSADV